MEPKLEQLNETSSTKRVTMEELSAQKSEKVDNCKNEEEIVGMLKKEVDDLKSNSDRELMEVKEKVEGNYCLNLRLSKFSCIIGKSITLRSIFVYTVLFQEQKQKYLP